MTVQTYLPGRKTAGKRVIALGFFDGVHVAHRCLLQKAQSEAKARGAEFCVFTFPSESGTLKPETLRLTTTEEKLSLLEEVGVERVVLADFGTVANLSPDAFVREVLVGELGCILVVCGYNFRYGKGASADAFALQTDLRSLGADAYIQPAYVWDGEPLSATRIRESLVAGDMKTVRRALGTPYRLRGEVKHGLGLGHTYEIPTVNLTFPAHVCVPASGVYRCTAAVEGVTFDAVTDIGVCPTFGARPVHAETYLIGFSGDLYGKTVCVCFHEKLRDEYAFPNENELKKQIKLDISAALAGNATDKGAK